MRLVFWADYLDTFEKMQLWPSSRDARESRGKGGKVFVTEPDERFWAEVGLVRSYEEKITKSLLWQSSGNTLNCDS